MSAAWPALMTTLLIIPPSTWVVLAGALAAAGLALAVGGLWPRPPSLKVALARMDGPDAGSSPSDGDGVVLLGENGSHLERWAARAFQQWRLPLSDQTRQCLARQNRAIGDFFAAKLAGAAAGLIIPALITSLAWVLGVIAAPWPLGFCLIGAVAGYFWPDLALRRAASAWREHSADAISVYFDLVTLIRLGNTSAVQALHEAAGLSQAPVFGQMRDALNRARLQQRPPWAELHRLAENMGLPEVGDLADIMALDEQGAALVDALRARVRELRKAHLVATKLAAQKKAEAMTVWMVVPVLVFALIFLIPPVMTMMAGL